MAAMVTTSGAPSATGAATTMARTDDAFRHEMEPRTLEQMFKIAAGFAKIGLCGVTSGEEAMARMLTGRELGLSTMLSMMSVYVVKGMPSLSAKLKHSLCLDRPDICEEFRLIESSNEKATFRAKRHGEPAQDFTFTIDDAKRAGYLDPKKPDSAWNCNPRRMLEARAKGHAADVMFPEILNGLATREEMEDARISVVQVDRTHAGDVPERVVVDAVIDQAPRDIDAEIGRLKEDIMNARTKPEKAEVRKRVAAIVADIGEGPQASDLKSFYNEHIVPAAKAVNGIAAPSTVDAAPAPPPSAPSDADEDLT
jgi:hypothetical protein